MQKWTFRSLRVANHFFSYLNPVLQSRIPVFVCFYWKLCCQQMCENHHFWSRKNWFFSKDFSPRLAFKFLLYCNVLFQFLSCKVDKMVWRRIKLFHDPHHWLYRFDSACLTLLISHSADKVAIWTSTWPNLFPQL